jgi:hypothetical protein
VQNLTTTYPLVAGDYVEARVFQGSAGALTIFAGAPHSNEFSLQRTG